MPLESLTHPDRPESHNPGLGQGIIIGALIGEVTSIDDPEGFGRVRVRAPLLDPFNDLPNNDDGWIPVVTRFTTNASAGGSHELIGVGTSVVVDSLFPANGRNWIVRDCVNSRVDRPHPDTNRAEGTYGTVTLNGVFDVSNDRDQSRIQSYPHGVVDYVSPGGDRLLETEEGARVQLTQDGNARLENTLAFTHVSADGTVSQRSGGGAQAVLTEDGMVRIDSAFSRGLRLTDKQSTLEGPLNEIAGALTGLGGFLRGHLGEAQRLVRTVGSLANELNLPLDLDGIQGVLNDADQFLERVQSGLRKALPKGLASLSTLQSASVLDLGTLLVPQLAAVRQYAPLIQQVETFVTGGGSGQDLVQQVLQIIPNSQALKIDGDRLGAVLDGLNHDGELQVEALLDAVLPDGFSEIQNLVSMGVHRIVPLIQEVISEPLPTDLLDIPAEIQRRAAIIFREIPERIRSHISMSDIEELVQSQEDRTDLLLGKIQKSMIGRAASHLTAVDNQLGSIDPLQQLVQSIRSGSLDAIARQVSELSGFPGFEHLPGIDQSDLQSLAREALSPILNQLPDLSDALEQVNQIAEAIPLDGATAVLRITNRIGELTDPSRTHSIYAGLGGAGLRSPWGDFSFGAAGGGLFSQGAFSLLSRFGGILMKEDGTVSLASLAGLSRDEDNRPVWSNEKARVLIDGDVIRLQSRNGSDVVNEIRIEPSGIYFGDYRLDDLIGRLSLLEQRGGSSGTG